MLAGVVCAVGLGGAMLMGIGGGGGVGVGVGVEWGWSGGGVGVEWGWSGGGVGVEWGWSGVEGRAASCVALGLHSAIHETTASNFQDEDGITSV